MRRSLRLAGAVFVGALLAGAATVGAATQVDDAAQVDRQARRLQIPAVPDLSPEERAAFDLVELINLERLQRGIPVLTWHDAVGAAAFAHSADMAAMRRMQHQGSDGSSAGERLEREGFTWITWGENIAAGFSEPSGVFEAWMGSPAHRQHLLGDYVYVGIGAVATDDRVPYWTLVVAS